MLKLILILLNFTFIFNQERLNVTEYVSEIIKCINNTENFSEDLKLKILSAYEKKDNSIFRVIGEFLLTHSNEMRKCVPRNITSNNLNQGPFNGFNQEKKYNEIIEKKYNWNGFLNCLETKVSLLTKGENVDSILELIDLIKNKDYLLAIRNHFRLKRFGNQIVMDCNIYNINDENK